MLRIAICDDSLEEQTQLSSIIREYREINAERFETELSGFCNALDMLAAMESGLCFDIILLDVIMPGMTGIEAARELRTMDKTVKIIFLTTSPEFAVDSYDVSAFYYALKPIWKEKLFLVLDRAVTELRMDTDESILIKSSSGLARVFLYSIEYIEVVGRKIFYHRTDRTTLEASGSMNETQATLEEFPQFIKAHRSYMINLAHVDKLSQRNIKMSSGSLLPLPKANFPFVKEKYLEWSFSGGSK